MLSQQVIGEMGPEVLSTCTFMEMIGSGYEASAYVHTATCKLPSHVENFPKPVFFFLFVFFPATQ